MPYDERALDAIVWQYREKRYCELTPAEVLELVVEIRCIGEQQSQRIRELEQIRAYQLAVLDQFDASVNHGVRRLEALANGQGS
ncbi:hypothetical protein ACFYUD_03735 [Nocardia tengchongensis]|uniref:hypothetical protein n=1 Tax=Nocardia tengchongensis TaxID=2055889 RepID=UPI0036C84E2C